MFHYDDITATCYKHCVWQRCLWDHPTRNRDLLLVFCSQKYLALMPVTLRSIQCMESVLRDQKIAAMHIWWCKKLAYSYGWESVDEQWPDHAASNQQPAIPSIVDQAFTSLLIVRINAWINMELMLKNKYYCSMLRKVCLLNLFIFSQLAMLFNIHQIGKEYWSVKYHTNWLCSKCIWCRRD